MQIFWASWDCDWHLRSLPQWHRDFGASFWTLFPLVHPLISIDQSRIEMDWVQNHLTQQMSHHLLGIRYFQSICSWGGILIFNYVIDFVSVDNMLLRNRTSFPYVRTIYRDKGNILVHSIAWSQRSSKYPNLSTKISCLHTISKTKRWCHTLYLWWVELLRCKW